tara:strand:- start:554 stop:730 length:177 start_codon:yes stop_codon:yes gene_type:complete
MEIEIIYRLAIPIILIAMGIWLRNLKEESSKGMKKYSLFFIIGGVILLALRLYKYFGI